jgi:DNA-binding response OmpR family regulator
VQGEARLRILLVEDDPYDAELVQACLAEARRNGAEIIHAASLAQGLQALRTLAIDLTVLDLDLPDSSGFETLRAREHCWRPCQTTPIAAAGQRHRRARRQSPCPPS